MVTCITRPTAFCGRLLLSCIAWLAFSGLAPAATTASITDTHPHMEAALAPGTSFHVLLDFETDEPVRLWVQPHLRGERVAVMSSGSPTHRGTGQTMGWFALDEPGSVDEIRIVAGGGTPYREWVVTSVPATISWRSGGSEAGAEPAWVGELAAAATAAYAQEAAQKQTEPASASDGLIAGGFMLLVIALLAASIAWPLRCARRWLGGWRIAASVPLGLMAFVLLRILIDTARDPTSHNLWPFEILMFGLISIAIVAALTIARRVLGVGSKPDHET